MMTTRFPWSPRLLTGAQRTALRDQLDMLRETAERAGRPGTVDMANRWASLLQRAPSIDAAHVTDFREEVDRCRLCVERALAETDPTGPSLADGERRQIRQLIDTLRLYPLISVPVPVEPSAYLVAADYLHLVNELETVAERARVSEPPTAPSGIPECLASVARLVAAATDGTAVRMDSAADGRAWAMGHVLEVMAAQQLVSSVSAVLSRAVAFMRLEEGTLGTARVHPDVAPLRVVRPREAPDGLPDAKVARLIDELTLALQHVGPGGLEAAVSAGQRHSTGFAESTDATQRVMMRAALQAYLESSGLRGMVARLADTVRRLPVAIPLEGTAAESPAGPSLVSSA